MPKEVQATDAIEQPADAQTTEETTEEAITEETTEKTTEGKEEQEQEVKPVYSKRLKVSGEERDITFNNQDDLDQIITKGLGADDKFREAAELREQISQVMEGLKGPQAIEILQKLGVNDEVLADYLYKRIQRENLSEEDKKRLAIEEENQKLKQQLEQSNKSTEQIKIDQEAQLWRERIGTVLIEKGLPNNKQTQALVAGIMLNPENGENITEGQAVDKLMGLMVEVNKNRIQNLPGEEIYSLLGDDIIKKIREFDISKIKKPEGQGMKIEGNKPVVKKKSKKLTMEEYRQQINDIIQGAET